MAKWLTYRTPACPRMFEDVPYVACTCADCSRIRRARLSDQATRLTEQDRAFLKSLQIATS